MCCSFGWAQPSPAVFVYWTEWTPLWAYGLVEGKKQMVVDAGEIPHPPFTLPNLPLHTLKWGLGLRMAPVVSLAELLAGSHVLQGQLHFWQNRLCPVLW